MGTITAYVIHPDGTAETVTWDSADGGLTTLQQAVGGTVDVIRLGADLDLWLHDEGKTIGLPFNPVATAIATTLYEGWDDFIVGPVVLTGGADDEGDTLSLTPADVEALSAVVSDYMAVVAGRG